MVRTVEQNVWPGAFFKKVTRFLFNNCFSCSYTCFGNSRPLSQVFLPFGRWCYSFLSSFSVRPVRGIQATGALEALRPWPWKPPLTVVVLSAAAGNEAAGNTSNWTSGIDMFPRENAQGRPTAVSPPQGQCPTNQGTVFFPWTVYRAPG